MRKNRWVTLVALVAGLSLAAVAFGQTTAPQPAPGPPAMSGPTMGLLKPAAGEVIKADAATKTLVIKGDKPEQKEMTFTVKEKAAGDLAAIKPGDKVKVQFVDEGGGKLAVESITRQ